jgi:hypothetical protein
LAIDLHQKHTVKSFFSEITVITKEEL